ncbi:MAG TPA: Rieske (2Fe-2S) protein, partial [Thermomonas sp.]|nr:Rieske (2Fe-2S) protein [Thermomonas sp.]
MVSLEALPPDSLHEVEAVIGGDAESLLLYRDASGDVRAWLNVCPH